MRTEVSKDLCISCGLCPDIAPELYKFDENEKAYALKEENLSEDEFEKALEAAGSCPVDAIIAEE